MLIVALVLAVIGLAALVTAVVTSNELIAWVCIAASVIGVVLLIVDALRERSRRGASDEEADKAPADSSAHEAPAEFDADYPDEDPAVADAETGPAPVDAEDDSTREIADEERNTR